MAKPGGRHRAARTQRGVGRNSVVGVAVAGVVALGLTPTVAAAPSTYYVRGTNIGTVPPDSLHSAWVDGTVGATAGAHGAPVKVEYPAGFWPISKGYFSDPTYDRSVEIGRANLAAAIAAGGDTDKPVIIHGYSMGAVVAAEYMREHPGAGNTYVLAGNPNRPNGGILARFEGLHIPILDITFNGPTPTDDEKVIDIARQYDGWADFPRYPLNLLATANALLGIVYLHGKYPNPGVVTPEVLAELEPTTHGNTTYYLVPTERLPLLMPFNGILPDQLLDALDPPLRALVELGYDRDDYGEPTKAGLFPVRKPAPVPADEPDPLATEPEPAQQRSVRTRAVEDADPAEKRRTVRTAARENTPGDETAKSPNLTRKRSSEKDTRAEDDTPDRDADKATDHDSSDSSGDAEA